MEERERKGNEKAEEGEWMDGARQITGAGQRGVTRQGLERDGPGFGERDGEAKFVS